ncbi:hypothetical protein JYU34_015157 [Plutella xylostella]|uniref:Uncharacterized protein n=1 Tax=Plutella xylostella TaxID=51655 RepID=A0ABQ7Q6F9_PLUXY|nr:hypothetical protein JYU34_015157 [Plutella xylostella]
MVLAIKLSSAKKFVKSAQCLCLNGSGGRSLAAVGDLRGAATPRTSCGCGAEEEPPRRRTAHPAWWRDSRRARQQS